MIFSSSPERSGRRRNSSIPSTTSTSRENRSPSSDSAPKNIPEIEERLRSRFEWGLIADIQPPDFETRVAILKKKAALERVLLADDVAYLMATRVKSNIRQLEGSLTRMIAFSAMTNREITVDLAQEVLADLWGADETIIPIELIQRKTAECFGVTLSDLKARNRTKAVALPVRSPCILRDSSRKPRSPRSAAPSGEGKHH